MEAVAADIRSARRERSSADSQFLAAAGDGNYRSDFCGPAVRAELANVHGHDSEVAGRTGSAHSGEIDHGDVRHALAAGLSDGNHLRAAADFVPVLQISALDRHAATGEHHRKREGRETGSNARQL